jgi:hypothetical protein
VSALAPGGPVPGVPMRRHNIGADLEVRVQGVTDEATARVMLDVRLARRSSADASGAAEAYHETGTRLRVPLHLVPALAEDLMHIARRAALAVTMGPIDAVSTTSASARDGRGRASVGPLLDAGDREPVEARGTHGSREGAQRGQR